MFWLIRMIMVVRMQLRVIFLIVLSLFILLPVQASVILSGAEIDLLVGTPTGVKEPLDNRRFNEDKSIKHDFSELLDDSFSTDTIFGEFEWSDAEEDTKDSSKETETQLLDLIAETEEMCIPYGDYEEESEDKTTNIESISLDYIETEFKL